MTSHQTDRHHFERQIVYARPIFILLALLAVLEQPPSREAHRSASFLIAYLTSALLITQIERLLRKRSWHLPLVCDLLALGFFMYISPSTVPVWFPYMFLCYAAGIRWGLELTLPLAGALSLILVLLTAVKGDIHWMRVVSWLGITIGTLYEKRFGTAQHPVTANVVQYAAGLAVGYYRDTDDLRANWAVGRRWTPNMDEETRESLYKTWKKAVTRSFDWIK